MESASKRVVYANDYSSINHCGSQLLNRNLKALIETSAMVSGVIPHNRLDDLSAFESMDCDVLVINGEGNFHSGNPSKLNQILQLATRARDLGRRAALINTVAHALPARIDISVFDLVAVRESESLKALQAAGFSGPTAVCPDATLLTSWTTSECRREGLIVTDCVVPKTAARLRRLANNLKATYVPFQCDAGPTIRWEVVLDALARAQLVVSGRYHANCFALLTGTPVVSVDSNTHKIRGMMADLNLGEYHFDTVAALAEFVASGRIPPTPGPLPSRDVFQRMLSIALDTNSP